MQLPSKVDLSPLRPFLENSILENRRVLDIFVGRTCGVDPFVMSSSEKVRRKLLMLYQEASKAERLWILHQFPELRHYISESAPSGVKTAVSYSFAPTSAYGSISSSCMWRRQSSYYEHAEMTAWQSTVPYEISSNRFVACQYVDIAEALTQKYRDEFALRPSDMVSLLVLEVAGGHGILSFLMAKELRERSICNCKVTVLCTDFHDSVFRRLLRLPWVRELCESGYLDYAILSAEDHISLITEPLHLLHSGRFISDMVVDAVLVVANYAFDSFPVDLFVKTSGPGPCFDVLVHDASDNLNSLPRKDKKRKLDSVREELVEPNAFDRTKYPKYGCYPRGKRSEDRKTALQDIIESDDKFPPGVYVVPVSGYSLLQRIKCLFNRARHFELIVGDYILCEDSKSWQLDEFDSLSHQIRTNCIVKPEEPIACGWFEAPLISPTPDVCAFPVCLKALQLAFSMAFSKGCKTDASTLRGSSNIFPSSFSVVVIGEQFPSEMDSCLAPTDQFYRHDTLGNILSFGPNELAHLRQLMKDREFDANNFRLQQWEAIMKLSCYDIPVFIEAMWKIRNRLKIESVENGIFQYWVDLVLQMFFQHSYSTSAPEFFFVREKIASWFVSLNNSIAAHACLELYGKDPSIVLSGYQRTAVTSSFSAVTTLNDVLLIHKASQQLSSYLKDFSSLNLHTLISAASASASYVCSELEGTVSDKSDVCGGLTSVLSINGDICIRLGSKKGGWLWTNCSRIKSVAHSLRKIRNLLVFEPESTNMMS